MMEFHSNCSYVKNNGRDDTTVLTYQHLTQHLDLAQFEHQNTHSALSGVWQVLFVSNNGKKIMERNSSNHVNKPEPVQAVFVLLSG